MIPINQQDYIRYQQALKGNRIKGAELFRSLLEDKTIAPVLAQTAAAAASVFTDCSQAANQMLPAILGETEYYEEMVLAYVNAGMGTNYATLAEAAEDSRFTKVFHGRDISQLPLMTMPGYRDLLCKPKIALGYSSEDAKYPIAAQASYITNLGMAAQLITFSDTYSWQWACAHVPGRGWYAFGAYNAAYSGTRTARAWRISGTTAVTAYTGSSGQEYIAAGYHPGQNKIYAFRTTNSTTSATGGAKSRTPEASLYLDIFTISSSGSLSRSSTTTIGTNVNVNEMLFDPARGKFVCVGNANPTCTFAGQTYTHSRTYAVPIVMVGDNTGWTAQLKYSFSRSPNSYIVRRLSRDKMTGNILFTMAFNTTFVLKPDNTIREVSVNSSTDVNYTFGNINIPVGKNAWIVNYYTANTSSSLNPYLLELNDDYSLKSFTKLSSSQFSTLCYDPMTRYLGMLAGNYYAFDNVTKTVRNYASTVITGLSPRYIFTAPDTAETVALSVGSEVNDYLNPGTSNKITIVKPAYWKEET